MGHYDQGKQVSIGTVYVALLVVRKMVALDYKGNPIEAQGYKYLGPMLSQTMGVWRKEDPPSKNKFPVGIDVPQFLAGLGVAKDATKVVKAVDDFALITCHYLLRVE